MWSWLSMLGDNRNKMAPLLRSRKQENADIRPVQDLSSAEVQSELERRGVDVDDLLREKLKELAEAEERSPSLMDVEEGKEQAEDTVELPVPVVAQKSTAHARRSTASGSPAPRLKRNRRRRTQQQQQSPGQLKQTAKPRNVRRKRRFTSNTPSAKKGKTDTESEEVSDSDVYDVEKILDVRAKRTSNSTTSKRQFLIRWTGYAVDYDEWVDEANLECALEDYKKSDMAMKKLEAGC